MMISVFIGCKGFKRLVVRRRAVLLVVACIFILAKLHGYTHELTHLESDSPHSECVECDQLRAFDDSVIHAAILPGILLVLCLLYTIELVEKPFIVRVISRARSPPAI